MSASSDPVVATGTDWSSASSASPHLPPSAPEPGGTMGAVVDPLIGASAALVMPFAGLRSEMRKGLGPFLVDAMVGRAEAAPVMLPGGQSGAAQLFDDMLLRRKVSPGDVAEFSGIFLPIPYTGFRAMRAGLVADTYLEAMSIVHFKTKYEEYELKGDEQEQIERLAEDGDIYTKLSRSLAPEIFGHEDVKKGLLLLLVGAPHRKLSDGMKIRGDLHICLMGDPGVAKSQLLKHIINVAPRGVYTTGRGSSGVGLTAAVQKDPVTNEFVLEGGALALEKNLASDAEVGRTEVFIACHTKKDKIEQCSEKIVLGKDTRGRVRAIGPGVSPSFLKNSSHMVNKIVDSQLQIAVNESEVEKLKKEMAQLKDYVTQEMAKSIHGRNVVSPQSTNPSTSSSSLPPRQDVMDIGKKCEVYGWGDILVAYGEVADVDPNIKVHTVTMGEGNYKVYIETVLVAQSPLFRSNSQVQVVADVAGTYTVWPKRSLKIFT